MGSIRKRSGRYQARVRRQGVQAVSRTFTTKKDALVWVRGIEAPPQRIVLEGAISLLFTLDASQCQTNLETVYGITNNCFAVLRWLSEKQQFYGYKSPINFVTSLN